MSYLKATASESAEIDINDLPDLLTLREVADLLRVAPLTIRRWDRSGKIKVIRINSRGDRRFRKEDILELLK